MINTITTWILTILTFLLGYGMGKNAITKENIQKVGKSINKTLFPSRVGLVARPTAQQLYDRENPKIAEEKQAIKEALDKISP